jgi:hypothetical protein
MVSIKKITDAQASECMEKGDFGLEIRKSNLYVVIILTHSWCPQWSGVQKMIEQLNDKTIDVWLFVYDRSPIFDTFMHYKESVLGNEDIPYLRYYTNGNLIHESNAVEKEAFLYNLKGKKN